MTDAFHVAISAAPQPVPQSGSTVRVNAPLVAGVVSGPPGLRTTTSPTSQSDEDAPGVPRSGITKYIIGGVAVAALAVVGGVVFMRKGDKPLESVRGSDDCSTGRDAEPSNRGARRSRRTRTSDGDRSGNDEARGCGDTRRHESVCRAFVFGEARGDRDHGCHQARLQPPVHVRKGRQQEVQSGMSMMKRHARAASIALVLFATAAHADVTKQDCVDANTKAQALQRDGKLRAAKEPLLVCASSSCPAIVRDDCTQQLDALNRKLPTLLFEVKDAKGNDVTAVTIMMDGQLLTDRVGAAAIPIDPGEHTFTFTFAGSPPVTKHFLLREGDKDRRERVVFGGATAPVQQPPHEPPVTTSKPPPPVETAPRAEVTGDVRVHFQQPEPTYSGATETWTLRDHDGKAICQLPCTQSVGPSSGYFMDAVVSRNGGEVVHQSLRIDIPDSLDRLPGSRGATRLETRIWQSDCCSRTGRCWCGGTWRRGDLDRDLFLGERY